uniref:U15-hexatoxin-Mg1a n=1 Tax=Macrothele gigas TaxID=223896 RepID=TXM15_MACGS|nr:RecName: Full=U15-hexatoxin-Mg1a; Short=U15-HXTX-Mg1a; AltName: Full=Neurotoxin magi-15 [Macrothele gigas]
ECSKQLGESCKCNKQCCGATVICGTIYVGGKEENLCIEKTSNNAILNFFGKIAHVVENGLSFSCD